MYVHVCSILASTYKTKTHSSSTAQLETHLSRSGTIRAGLGFCAMASSSDMPGHSTSWQRGYPQISSNCSGSGGLSAATASGFTTPMDPTANATYKLLETLLEELDPLFPSAFPFWHLGGDEVQ